MDATPYRKKARNEVIVASSRALQKGKPVLSGAREYGGRHGDEAFHAARKSTAKAHILIRPMGRLAL